MTADRIFTPHNAPEQGDAALPDTILLFEKPEAYFFPFYKDRVFAPFGVPQPSFRYLAYQLMRLLHLPCRSMFWGQWKDYAKRAKRVVIFDYGYQSGMERYIRRVNPQCRVFLFFWNKVNRYNRQHLRFSNPGAIFSTDREDCARYGLKYNHIFYPMEFHTPYIPRPEQNRLFFLGADKGRAPYIAALKQFLEKNGLICDIRVLPSPHERKSPGYRERFRDILTDRRLSYGEYLEILKSRDILLDVNQEGQSALTMRVMESIYLSKKLITGNRHVLNYDFYHPDNILVLPEGGLPAGEDLLRFLRAPFRPYPEDVLEHYSFEHWLEGFTE